MDDSVGYTVDDRGNVVDFYVSFPGKRGNEWERRARLDREAGPSPCNQLAWDNDDGVELEEWARSQGYGEQIDEAKDNARNGFRQEYWPFKDMWE